MDIHPSVAEGAGVVEARPDAGPTPSTSWVRLGPGRRYFETEDGRPFLVIGQNDALTWPDLEGLLGRRDPGAVDRHLAWLRKSGVTTLRVMLEYVGDGLYLESQPGEFDPVVVRAIDDLVALCERHGLRLLLTPFDTFFTWVLWDSHPYNAGRGGPCRRQLDLLTDPDGMAAVKRRFAFVVERWGGSGAIFAWDLWNELGHDHGVASEAIGPDLAATLIGVVSELSHFVRGIERSRFGRAHLQTVSHFGAQPEGPLADLIFRHPDLDFATTHVYEPGQIDSPTDTVGAAEAMARWVRHALAEIRDGRPFTDSETGPIHTFKDLGITLPETFDLNYFRHMSWAHLASGGAGGGMRWPNRHPHSLTPGMRHAQGVMAEFAGRIDWPAFASRNVTAELKARPEEVAVHGCSDGRQAVIWAIRSEGSAGPDGDLCFRPLLEGASVELPGMEPGAYRVDHVETANGHGLAAAVVECRSGPLTLDLPPFRHDVAIAVRPAAPGRGRP
ncbi:hypothetical protein OJF2_40650 [Aquisphaera giovannonii]|uniref:Sugar-binding cellulase-like protein n=1 Tax=Aquisphaera giovannonii TaxID=406548 RepID=A0A5B9W4G8_9BACT|nr:hypothetical protein [Aquisphaera giovannonii]QEH35513.1 hypothetical protein OJF2_40650 [Aquisphaera giovannonii]